MNEAEKKLLECLRIRTLLSRPRAKAYLVISIFVGFLMAAAACQDAVAPLKKPKVSLFWEDYSQDSICWYHFCSEPTNQQALELYTVVQWLNQGPYTDCWMWAGALQDALDYGYVQIVDTFDSPTQQGAYIDSTGVIYFKQSFLDAGVNYAHVGIGHEAGHAAGYGNYPNHQTYMDNFSTTCQPGH